ncbi:LacI family DNA-binding transcriptional regulator [Actinomadura sp. 9N407]|uniref:LacI family DNA-binding transcriptional regulator n=1 Tax=Actinomadura sp. 9N407 TaxID=3375154 RepID=UPI00378A38A1
MAGRRVTISDVAKLAGVSVPTVSRALNGRPEVIPETRERVLRAAEELDYVPSRSARSLRTGKFAILGLLVPQLAWDWMPEVIRGVSEEADRSGYSLLLQQLSSGSENRFVESVLPMLPVDGLVMVIPSGLMDRVGELHRQGMPVVVVDDQIARPEFPSVEIDNAYGVRCVTEHLIESGRERIAFAAAAADMLLVCERLAGYRQAVAAAGLPELGILRQDKDFDALLHTVVSRAGEFDAVVTPYDELAVSLVSALHAVGVHVPGDVAVTGFDDLPAAAWTGLTTVRSPFYEMGATAVRMLITAIDGGTVPERTVLPVEIVLRDSTRTNEGEIR